MSGVGSDRQEKPTDIEAKVDKTNEKLRQAKSRRAAFLGSLTKKVQRVEEIIDNRGSRTLLCALRESIATTSAKIQDANKDYVSKTSDRDELSAADAWLVEAEEKTDLAYSYLYPSLPQREA